MGKIKTYLELIQYSTYEDRLKYLMLFGSPGYETFGYDRYLSQDFYRSKEWRDLRNRIIARDKGNDLGCEDVPIGGKIFIHHIEPLTVEDVVKFEDKLTDPNNLICVSKETHDAIHYGRDILVKTELVERKAGDTCPWKKN